MSGCNSDAKRITSSTVERACAATHRTCHTLRGRRPKTFKGRNRGSHGRAMRRSQLRRRPSHHMRSSGYLRWPPYGYSARDSAAPVLARRTGAYCRRSIPAGLTQARTRDAASICSLEPAWNVKTRKRRAGVRWLSIISDSLLVRMFGSERAWRMSKVACAQHRTSVRVSNPRDKTRRMFSLCSSGNKDCAAIQ
jgi:hypothetical protein